MSSSTVTKEIQLAGFYVEIEAEFDLDWTDNGIGSYEYWGSRGVHHDWGWEVGECTDCNIISDLKEIVTDELHARGLTNHNRRWKKQRRHAIKRIERAFEKFDPDSAIDTDDIIDAAPDEPDEPDYDREPGVSSFSYD